MFLKNFLDILMLPLFNIFCAFVTCLTVIFSLFSKESALVALKLTISPLAAKASSSVQYCHKIPGHGVKVGPGPRDLRTLEPRTRDRPQSLKVGPGTPLKFTSGTPGPPTKFKSGTPSPCFNEFIFFRIFLRFFYLFIFVSFLNKVHKNINCE